MDMQQIIRCCHQHLATRRLGLVRSVCWRGIGFFSDTGPPDTPDQPQTVRPRPDGRRLMHIGCPKPTPRFADDPGPVLCIEAVLPVNAHSLRPPAQCWAMPATSLHLEYVESLESSESSKTCRDRCCRVCHNQLQDAANHPSGEGTKSLATIQ